MACARVPLDACAPASLEPDMQCRGPRPVSTCASRVSNSPAATLEEIEEACRETPFHTPLWKGRTPDTDIPERTLEPAEVDVINKKYLELKAAFDAKRQSQSAGGEASSNVAVRAAPLARVRVTVAAAITL